MKIGNVTFTGTIRARLYVWDWFKAPPGQNEYAYSGNFIRLNFAETQAAYDWDAEFTIPILLGLPSKATEAAPQGALGLGSNYYTANKSNNNAAMIFPRQLYLRLHLGGERQKLKIGRLLFADGNELVPKDTSLAAVKRDHINQRLIGDFGFSDIGRSFDGVQYSYTRGNDNFTLVSATPTRGVFQVDGWGWNRVGFGYASYTHETSSAKHSSDTRLFAIGYDDWRHILKTDNRPLTVRNGDKENILIGTFGGHTVHDFTYSAGTLDVLGWGAVQTGRWGTQRQQAYAFDFEGGFQPAIWPKWRPWIRGGYTVGSGDGNANDKTHGTFFQLLPTPRVYARTPFFNMMNLDDGFGAFILRPQKKVTISSEFHSLRLNSAKDLWYSGGGVFQPWTFGYTGRSTSGYRSLANLYDTSVEYRASRQVTLTAYVGYMEGLAAIHKIYPKGTEGQLGYLEMLYRF